MCDFIQRTDWYLFDLHSQKMIFMILHQCQQPNLISLKSLGTMNMVTGIQVLYLRINFARINKIEKFFRLVY